MEKLGLLKSEKMGEYEKEQGRASYRTLINYYIGDIVLCNNIIEVDDSIYCNMKNGIKYIDYETGEEHTEEEYNNDESGKIEIEYEDIYQYYLCHISEYEEEQLLKSGVILSYSDLLDCDVLCVDHWGTSWDYVLTSVPLFDTWEELEAYEKEDQTNEGE